MGKKIAVLGTGANGASIGVDLTLAGEDVTFIEQWPDHVAAMRKNGAIINMPEKSITSKVNVINLYQVAELKTKFDIVFMLLKAYDSRWGAELIKPYLKEDGLLIGVQNGMSIDDIAEIVGTNRTLGCVIEITSAMEVAGVVERHSGPERSWFALGSLVPETISRENEIADLLRKSGSVEIVENIRATKWMKLVSNATTLVTTAILGLPMIEANANSEMRKMMLASGNEALNATLLLGNPILPIFGLKPEDVKDKDAVVEKLLDTLLSGFVLPKSKTTILQDWSKGRHSEVNEINGLVARTHQQFGKRAPFNEAIVEFALKIESGELNPSPDNLAPLLKRFAELS